MVRHHYEWTNYHDTDSKLKRAFKGDFIPLVVLVDAQGKIVYYESGGDEVSLRKAVASLDPRLSSTNPPIVSTSSTNAP